MADNIQSEAVNSAGVVFATDENAASSVHYPIGKLAWGALNTFNITSTSAPFPVQVSGYVAPSTTVTVTGYVAPSTTVTITPNDSGTPFYVRGIGSSSVPVSGSVTIDGITTSGGGGALDSTNSAIRVNVVAGSAGGSSTVTVTNNSGDLLYVSDSATPVFVRGLSDSTVPVSGTVSVSGYVAPSTTVTVTGYVAPSTTVTVTGYVAPSTTVTVTGYTAPSTTQGINGLSSATGALVSQTFALSSLAQTVMTAVGRLYGLSLSNPDTAANVWAKVYDDDSGGVTLGTTAANISVMVPFGGGREMSWPVGLNMSSGMSVAASLTAPSTAHDAPSTTIYLTAYYAPST